MRDKIGHIEKRLSRTLPGVDAQKEMAPVVDVNRFDLKWKKSASPGGVMLLLYPKDGELYIPFMQRPDYGGAHSGQISFPGGKKEEEDSDLIATALRESQEELGIPRHRVEVLGVLTELFIIASNFNVLPVVAYMDERPDFQLEEREVLELIETPVSHFLRKENVKRRTITVAEKYEIDAPYYDLDGRVLWGATAMILSEFLTIYKDL